MSAGVTWDVVVAGAGPTGTVLAALLGRRGLRVLLADTASAPFPLPRAVALDDDVLRVLRTLGVAVPLNGWQRAGFLDARGRLLLDVGFGETDLGLPGLAFVHQPTLEAALRAALPPSVMLRPGADVRFLAQDPDGVDIAVAGERQRGRWLVGCDGASSPLRAALGVAWRGRTDPRRWLVVDVALEAPLPALPYFSYLCDPDRPGVTMPLPGGHRFEWMLADGEDPDPGELLAPYLRDVAGARLERTATYAFGARTAARWRVGRALLAGDAAHTMPPFAGQGMGAGIRDAAQLAWRLDELVRATPVEADPLAAWERERRAQLRRVVALSRFLGLLVTTRRDVPRDAFLRTAAAAPALGGWLRRGGPRPPSGPRLPAPRVRRLDGTVARLDDVLPEEWVALGLGCRPPGPRPVAVLPPGGRRTCADPAALEDLDGTLLTLLRRHGGTLLARPDRLLAPAPGRPG